MKYSIIIPVFNCEKYLEKCINSVLNQTYKNFELIIINDGSKDNSMNIINRRCNGLKNVTIIDKKNSGVSDTRNLGISKSTGEWITFIDADDWIEVDTLDSINKIIENNNDVDLIISNLYINGIKKEKIPYKTKKGIVNNKKELIDTTIAIDFGEKKYGRKYGNCRCIGGKFYKAKVLKDNSIKFPEDISSFEDGIFNLYCEYYSKKIYIENKALYHYFSNNNSRTHLYNENQSSENKKILNHIIQFNELQNNGTEAIAYCALDLLTIVINNIVYENGNDALNGINKLSIELKMNKMYFKNNVINKKYLNLKNKVLLSLIKRNSLKTIYNIYLIKRKFK